MTRLLVGIATAVWLWGGVASVAQAKTGFAPLAPRKADCVTRPRVGVRGNSYLARRAQIHLLVGV